MSETFFENVARAVAVSSRYKSEQDLSFEVCGNKKFIAQSRSQRREIKLSTALAISDALGIPIDQMSRPGSVLLKDFPDFKYFMAAHEDGGGKLSAFGTLVQYTDLYYPPCDKDEFVRPAWIGPLSASSRTLEKHGLEAVQEALNSSQNSELKKKYKAKYKAAAGGLPIIENDHMDEPISVPPYRIILNYTRLMLLVKDDLSLVATDKQTSLLMLYCIDR